MLSQPHKLLRNPLLWRHQRAWCDRFRFSDLLQLSEKLHLSSIYPEHYLLDICFLPRYREKRTHLCLVLSLQLICETLGRFASRSFQMFYVPDNGFAYWVYPHGWWNNAQIYHFLCHLDNACDDQGQSIQYDWVLWWKNLLFEWFFHHSKRSSQGGGNPRKGQKVFQIRIQKTSWD